MLLFAINFFSLILYKNELNVEDKITVAKYEAEEYNLQLVSTNWQAYDQTLKTLKEKIQKRFCGKL